MIGYSGNHTERSMILLAAKESDGYDWCVFARLVRPSAETAPDTCEQRT